MKQLIVIILLTLVSCGPRKCPDGQYFECGKGCVDIPKVYVDLPKSNVEVEKETSPVNTQPPMPRNTKFSVTDIVCVWEKDTGVVIDIHWGKVPDGHDPVLVYTVQFYNSDKSNGEYYETELQRGKCQP